MNTRIWIFLITCLISTMVGADSGKPRLAVVGEGRGEAVAELLTAQLSAEGLFDLVERQHFQALLDELELEATGSAAATLNFGRMVGADGLLLLQPEHRDGAVLLVARLIAVQPGVILSETVLPLDLPIDEVAQHVRRRVAAQGSKLAIPPDAIRRVSMAGFRSPVAWSETARHEEMLSMLLTHRLIELPDVYVLERARMREMWLESQWRDQHEEFWSGSLIVEGLTHSESESAEDLDVEVWLRGPDGEVGTRLRERGAVTNLSEVVDRLVLGLAEVLEVMPVLGVWDRDAEANLYAQEAQWAYNSGRYEAARQAAEAARALGRRDSPLLELSIRAACQSIYPPYRHTPRYDPSRIDQLRLGPGVRTLTVAVEWLLDALSDTSSVRASDGVNWNGLAVDVIGFGCVFLRAAEELNLESSYRADLERLRLRLHEVIRRLWDQTQGQFRGAHHVTRYLAEYRAYLGEVAWPEAGAEVAKTPSRAAIQRAEAVAPDLGTVWIEVNRVWTGADVLGDAMFPRQVTAIVLHDGEVYYMLMYLEAGRIRQRVVQVNPRTLETRILEAPDGPRPIGHSFSLPQNNLAVSDCFIAVFEHSRLHVYDRLDETWREYEIPPLAMASIALVNDRIHLGSSHADGNTYSAILELDPITGQIQVLASSRRRPAKTRLDDIGVYQVQALFRGLGGDLYAKLFMPNQGSTVNIDRYDGNDWPTWASNRSSIEVREGNRGTLIWWRGRTSRFIAWMPFDGDAATWLIRDGQDEGGGAMERGRWAWSGSEFIVDAAYDGRNLWMLVRIGNSQEGDIRILLWRDGVEIPIDLPLALPESVSEPLVTEVSFGRARLHPFPHGVVISTRKGILHIPTEKVARHLQRE